MERNPRDTMVLMIGQEETIGGKIFDLLKKLLTKGI